MGHEYVSRLTDKQILNLHRLCQVQDISDKIKCVSNKDDFYVVFYEGIEKDGSKLYVHTSYRYFDFKPPVCYDCGDIPCDMEKYYGYMIGVFGKPYLLDLIKDKLNVNDEFVVAYFNAISAMPGNHFSNHISNYKTKNSEDIVLDKRFSELL